MPRFAALALNKSCKELCNAGLFVGEWVKDSVDAIEL